MGRKSVHGGERRWGLVERAGLVGVSNTTLMNQCQWSDEEIIKKQDSAVLTTAKGKRPIHCIETQSPLKEKNANYGAEENPYHNRCQNALQIAL